MRIRSRWRIVFFLLASPSLIALAASKPAAPVEAKAALRGYFMAASPRATENSGPGANYPKQIRMPVPPGRLSLIALPDQPRAFRKQKGFRVVLANATRKEIWIEAEDTRISIVREAMDAKGKWRPIEYLPHSWCGNSYYSVVLPAGHAWTFAAPEYTGPFRTKMRFKLEAQEGRPALYSNVFDGWIHYEQFEKKEGHVPSNIMDPYDE